jgi:hypothetical protein
MMAFDAASSIHRYEAMAGIDNQQQIPQLAVPLTERRTYIGCCVRGAFNDAHPSRKFR